jgi:6-phosphogluconolactonase (cycloisomerase 2 family)
MRLVRNGVVVFAGLVIIAMGIRGLPTVAKRASVLSSPESSSGYRLVSIQKVSDFGEICLPAEPGSGDANPDNNLFASYDDRDENHLLDLLRGRSVYAATQENGQTLELNRQPVRRLWDTDPSYGSIAFDPRTGKVFLQDLNLWAIRIFDRMTNTPANANRSEPERVIQGKNTELQFNTCMYIDPVNGDIYTVENDIGDSIKVFSQDASGNTAPKRNLKVTHRAHTITIDEQKEELFVSVNYPPQVEVYRKTASGNEKPLRVVTGESTRLADVHGIALDQKAHELFVNNWGHISQYNVAGSGRFEEPSITVYPLDANGDTAPLRIIQGARTQLDWPGAMFVDPDKGEMYVTNSGGQSILVFGAKDRGDVPPRRILKGPRTGLSYPSSLAVDIKNQELWVSNLGSASATVYPLTANGDVPPLRTIRSAPANKVSLKFGKTQAVTYDSKREEILVPN